MPKLSIIVPVYKAEDHLPRCIDSILAQSFEDFEIILVDDGSPDKSGMICDLYAKKDSRVKVIHKKNGGVSSARNEGIRNARGRYVQFVDSDDYIDSDMCLTLLNSIEDNQTDMVVCGYAKHYKGNKKDIIYKQKIYASVEELEIDFSKLFDQLFFNYIWNKLYRKDLILTLFDIEINYGEDLLFNLVYLTNCNKLSIISEPYYHYHYEDNSLSTIYSDSKASEAIKLHYATLKFFNKYFQDQGQKKIIYRRHFVRSLVIIDQLINKSSHSYDTVMKKLKILLLHDTIQESVRNSYNTNYFERLIGFLIKKNMRIMIFICFKIKNLLLKLKNK